LLRTLSILITVLLIAACGGGGTPAAAPSAPAAAGESAAPAPAATAGASQAAAGPAFADILRSGKLTSYRVSYKMTTTGSGQDTGALEQTWYFKPPNTRLDFAMSDGYGGTSKISMFYLATGSYFCTIATEGNTCMQVAADGAGAQNLGFEIQDSFQNDPSAFNATISTGRSIAGQTALCYVIKGAAAVIFSEGTFCYTQTGVPLLSQWSAAGSSFTMEATSFTADVPDSDFVLPATPMKLP
jgi:hypothetical protein